MVFAHPHKKMKINTRRDILSTEFPEIQMELSLLNTIINVL